MAVQTKYQALIDAAHAAGVQNLTVREQENILYIDGEAPSEEVKKQIWNQYNQIDPDYKSGDLILNINVAPGASEEYTVVSGDSLSKIGQRYGVSWKEIYDANTDQIKNPDLIQPGWKLKIPKK